MKRVSTFLLLLSCWLCTNTAEAKTKIKAVVFDFNGVIVKTDRQIIVDFIAKSLGITSIEANLALTEMKTQKLKTAKEESNFWVRFAQSNKIELPIRWEEQYRKAKLCAAKEIPGMVDVVKKLQKQGIVTGLLTNAKQKNADLKKELGLYDLFEPAVFAYKVGIKKPDPKIYHMLLNKLQMSPYEVIFVDNTPANIEAAKEIGMDTILFTNAPRLIEELKIRGLQ